MTNSPWEDDEIVRANRRFHERPWWERSSGETIDDILGDAANGHLSGTEVEAIARDKGWRDPMSSWEEGSPGIFEQDHWNFAMAIAWICWRSDDAVREVWPHWLERHYRWRKTTVDRPGSDGTQVRVSGQVLEPFDASIATVFRLRNLALSKGAPHLPSPATSIKDGIDDLLLRIRAGDVHASCRGEIITRERWFALTHDGISDGPEPVGLRGGREMAPDWEILIPKSEILELWPMRPPAAGSASDGPDPSQLDPMKETDWSLGMAIAWIAYRSVNLVREYWPQWRQAAGRRAPEGGLCFLMMHEATTTSEGESLDSDMRVSVRASRRLLWEALRNGSLQAVTLHDGGSHVIPKHEWGQLKPACSATFHDQLHWAQNDRLVGIAYPEPVQIERSSILSEWPAEAPDEPVAPCAAPPWQERFKDGTAWFRAEGEEKARNELLAEGESPRQSSICVRAAANWNTDMPSTRRPVKPKSFVRANQRIPKSRQ